MAAVGRPPSHRYRHQSFRGNAIHSGKEKSIFEGGVGEVAGTLRNSSPPGQQHRHHGALELRTRQRKCAWIRHQLKQYQDRLPSPEQLFLP